jgi:hypothetical protein
MRGIMPFSDSIASRGDFGSSGTGCDSKARAVATIEDERLAKERTFKTLSGLWLKRKVDLRSLVQI